MRKILEKATGSVDLIGRLSWRPGRIEAGAMLASCKAPQPLGLTGAGAGL